MINIDSLRHPKEKLYGGATLIIGGIIWALIILPIIFAARFWIIPMLIPIILALGFFYLVLYITQQFFRAEIYGNSVEVSPTQYPHIYKMVEDAAREMGVNTLPETFIVNSQGLTNALAVRFAGARFIILYSSVVDIADDKQLKMLVGHEMAHHAAGHLSYFLNFVRLPSSFIPFLGAAYSRSRELSCDRIGAAFNNDSVSSQKALFALACGAGRLMNEGNIQSFIAQEHKVPPFIGWLVQIYAAYPRMTTRIIELEIFEGRGNEFRRNESDFIEKMMPKINQTVSMVKEKINNATDAPKKFCGQCGAQNQIDAAFCQKCGSKFH